MEEDSILLSEKYGLNPSIEVCVLCGTDIGVILYGKLENDVEAPKQVCCGNLCDKCTSRLRQEHKRILLEVSEGNMTGRYYEISEDNITKEFLDKTTNTVLLIEKGTI